MMRMRTIWALGWSSAVVGWSLAPSEPAAVPALGMGSSRAPIERGVKATFEPIRKGDGVQPHSVRMRLLSLAVERGETPTPFLPAGAFRATFRTTVTLPARDRMRFRVDGRGRVDFRLNGESLLEGVLRGNKSLETDKPVRLGKGENALEVVFESSARGDGQLRVFWAGVDFGFEPIAPELLSYDAGDADVVRGEQLRLGQQLFVSRRCARCHDFPQERVGESAFRELDRAGPDLRQIASRARPGWLAAWLRDPRAIRSDASMPRFPLSEGEIGDAAAYLASLGAPLPAPAFAPDAARTGGRRFRELGCIACHLAPAGDLPGEPIGDRIALAFVGGKWHAAALIDYLQHPARHYPDVRMPDFKLSRDDAIALAAYLLVDAKPPADEPGDAARGRGVVQKHGCYLCHALGDDVPPGDRVFPRLRNLKPGRGCLADDPRAAGAPDHGLTAAQREALRAFLPFAGDAPFRRSPVDYTARHFAADRCDACHALDGMPSVWARLAERLSVDEPLPQEQDPVAQGVPALTWVGAKLQPSWIAGFVTGEIASPRPWLTARMPAFAEHGAAISAGLVREHGYGDQDEPVLPGNAQLAIHGERLVKQGSGFGCVQCHALGNQPAVQVFEREGIELTTARGRLRHEYYTRWLADPTRLDPDSRMPKYADAKGKTAFTDVLDGNADEQFEAIWQYLGSLRKTQR